MSDNAELPGDEVPPDSDATEIGAIARSARRS